VRAAWWWIDRWRKSTAYTDMTAEEQGVYRNLLDECWLRGGVIPPDDFALKKISGDPDAWPRVKDKVLARFYEVPGGLRNETADEVIRKSGQIHEARSKAGKAGAAKREANRQAKAEAKPQANGMSPSPSPSPYPEPEPRTENNQSPIPDGIEQVFAYWKKRTNRTKGTILSPDRKAKLLRRYVEQPGTAEEKVAALKLAVDGAIADPWFSGDNERGKRYWGFNEIFRNRDRVEKLQEAARAARPPPEEAPAEDEVPESNLEAEEAWDGVKTILSGTIPGQNFSTWFRPTFGHGWEMNDISGDRVLVVTVPSPEHRKQIREVYGERVKKLLSNRNVRLLRLAVRSPT